MVLTPLQTIIMILAIAAGTIITRFTPFILFPEGKKQPKIITYLSKVLPAAVMGLLIIYCLKDVRWMEGSHGIPEMISIAVVAGMQLWRRHVLLSILIGTVTYMFLVQVVF